MNITQLAKRAWPHIPPVVQDRLKGAPVFGALLAERDHAQAELADLRQQSAAQQAALLAERDQARAEATALRQKAAEQWVPAGHFYSPLPDLNDIRARRDELFGPAGKELPGVSLNQTAQLALVRKFKRYHDEQPFPDEKSADFRFYYQNGFFSWADGMVLYCMLRHLQPKRYLEIGSGFSSALVLDCNERFFADRIQLTLIEPYTDRLEELLRPGDEQKLELVRSSLQAVPLERFKALAAGDILFIDSTHVTKVGSDLNQIFFKILPLLASGVYVHFHDIFYPFEYLEDWVLEGRAWNEAYLLHAFLQYNSAFTIEWFNHYLYTQQRAKLEKSLPYLVRNQGGSIWLKRT